MSAPEATTAPETRAKVGYRSLFAIRDYRLLFAGLVTSQSGSWVYNVALVVYVFNATHSPGWVAAASMTRFLSALLSSAFGGVVADRVERVRLMVTIDTCAMVVQGLLAVAAGLSSPVLVVMMLAALTSLPSSGVSIRVSPTPRRPLSSRGWRRIWLAIQPWRRRFANALCSPDDSRWPTPSNERSIAET
jgi:MFS family permease